ncbi:MAG: Fe-S protein assembly co-chaperone HscB [Magnetococcales bacterium]|nr:Fe-S protein assembly co-chaperone HscB [Magnetococcales bacterium]MBF0151588.1 Fe-S protein assembly co-chaperone HscB [Magnetococcales bacterium]
MNRMEVCWSCRGGVVAGTAFCPTCRVIQPPDPRMDHFRYFDLNPGFEVDLAVLDGRYRERQQRFHPDLFVSRGAAERRYSMEHVTRLNEGYRLLKDPLRRGEYLLHVTGFRTRTPENSVPADPSFLMEMMELREALEDVDVKRSDAEVRLGALRRQVEEGRVGEIGALSRSFAAWFSGGERHHLDVAAERVDRLRYFTRFLDELERKEEEIY